MPSKKQPSRRNKPEAARGKKVVPAKRSIPLSPVEEHFVRGVIVRGEAACPDDQGNLPAGATHEILEQPKDGLPRIARRRFSIL